MCVYQIQRESRVKTIFFCIFCSSNHTHLTCKEMGKNFVELASKTLFHAITKSKTLKIIEDEGFHWSKSKICRQVLKIDGTIDKGSGEYNLFEMIEYFVNLMSRVQLLSDIAKFRRIGLPTERSMKDVLADLEGKIADVPTEFRDVDFTKIFTSGGHYWREHWRMLLSIFLDVVAMTAHFDSTSDTTKLKCEPKDLISKRSSINDIKETTFMNAFEAIFKVLGHSDALQVLLNDTIETELNLRNDCDVIEDVAEWTKKEKFDVEFGLSTTKAICAIVRSKQVSVARLKSAIVGFGCTRSTLPILMDMCKIKLDDGSGTPDESADPFANDPFAECEES